MKIIGRVMVLVVGLFASLQITRSQNLNIIEYPELERISARKEIKLPDIPGYKTLKCDFHIHTIFSDGIVTPEYRVDEAWEEGLDAIAITDHIENQPSREFVKGDHNSSYIIASKRASEKNIILIRAGEITRSMPPGHLNALFLNDVNLIDLPDPLSALEAAKKQGAFIQWNHPGWKAQQPDTCRWMPMHQQLFEKGLINGIEVFNEKEYYPVVLDWCISKKLTVLCNSDIHDITASVYDLAKGHRPITLVFAKNRSAESIKEAMFNGRTLAYFGDMLAGKEEFLRAIFEASLLIRKTGFTTDNKLEGYELKNVSAIPIVLQDNDGDVVTVPAESAVILQLGDLPEKEVTVNNFITGSATKLHIRLHL